MVYLYRCCVYCILYFASQITFAQVINFPNSNTIPVISGNTAKLVGVTSINSTARSASVVIDARDKFGNKMRLFKTATFSPAKIREYTKNCLKNPAACAAATALTTALIYYGYSITPEGLIVLPGNSGSYLACVDKPVAIDGGGVANAIGPLPCALGPNWAGVFTLYTLEPMPPSPNLIQVQQMNGFYFVTDTQGHFGIHYQNFYNSQPRAESETQPITDERLAEIALENPAYIQIAPGVYPDIFNPVEVTETLPEEAISHDPDPETENQTDAQTDPEYEDMIGMEAIPEQSIDISSYFDWGYGWLPKSCPPPKTQTFQGQQFSFDLSLTCAAIEDYVAPAVRAFAIFLFLAIVIGGARV